MRFLQTLRHRNIVLFHGAGLKDGKRMIVTEFVERGSLRSLLDNTDVSVLVHESQSVPGIR